jgi:hypothetical protein
MALVILAYILAHSSPIIAAREGMRFSTLLSMYGCSASVCTIDIIADLYILSFDGSNSKGESKMTSAVDKSIQSLVTDILEGKLLLPEMQRPFVWKDYQVRDLFDSLYRNYPSGSLLVWDTDELPSVHPLSVGGADESKSALLLLDGQQRLTSLSAILSGRPLIVSNRENPITVLFNLGTEMFDTEEVIPKIVSRHGQRSWISLAQYFNSDTFSILGSLGFQNMTAPETREAASKLEKLAKIKNYTYRVNILDHMEYGEVTRIFIRVNYGGTRLGNADLALAQISSRWPGVADKVSDFNDRLKRRGLIVSDPGVAMRTLSALTRHKTRLDSFFRKEGNKLPSVEQLETAWANGLTALEKALNFAQQNCYVDKLHMMPSPYVLVPLIAFFDKNKDTTITPEQSKQLEQWFYRVTVWSRYSTSTETKLDQDLRAIYEGGAIGEQIDALKEAVDVATGKRQVTEKDIRNRTNSPFLLIMRILARRNNAQDWISGISLGADKEVRTRPLFTERFITGADKKRRAQDIANQILSVSDLDLGKSPAELLGSLNLAHLQAQQIPSEPALWEPENYDRFLAARRQILSQQTNLLMYAEIPQVTADLLCQRITALELQLREVIATQLIASEGERAWERLVPRNMQTAAQQHIDKKTQENPALRDEFDSIEAKLRQCMFSDLRQIMEGNWSLFSEMFGQLGIFLKQFQFVLTARNGCAHDSIADLSTADRLHAQAGLEWFDDCLSQQVEIEA